MKTSFSAYVLLTEPVTAQVLHMVSKKYFLQLLCYYHTKTTYMLCLISEVYEKIIITINKYFGNMESNLK